MSPHFSSTNNWGTINYVFGLLMPVLPADVLFCFFFKIHCLFELIKPEMEIAISFNILEQILKKLEKFCDFKIW